MSSRIDMRECMRRFHTLEWNARRHAQDPSIMSVELDLHYAALSYAAAVRKVARARRDS